MKKVMDDVKGYVESFSRLICSVTEMEKTLLDIEEYFNEYPINNDGMSGRVWVLLGRAEGDSKYNSLMVAQSEDIKKEIVFDIGAMFNMEYRRQRKLHSVWDIDKEIKYNLDVIKSPQLAEINSNGNTYLFQKGHNKIKSQYLYRYLKKKFQDLRIYEVDIDKYLKAESSENINATIYNVFNMGKDYWAESKLAVETNALFWNYYNSGLGKRAYCYFRKKEN